MEIISVIIAGIIIGLLGKFVAPGDKDNIPIWLTIILGLIFTATMFACSRSTRISRYSRLSAARPA